MLRYGRVKCGRLVGLAKASQDRRQTMCIFLASISSDNYTVFTEDGFPVLFHKYFLLLKPSSSYVLNIDKNIQKSQHPITVH